MAAIPRGLSQRHPGHPVGCGVHGERTRAVVQVGSQCGSLCGQWHDYFLNQDRVGLDGHAAAELLRRVITTSEICILRRMPRMQVYLPDALHEQVKARGLPVSELLRTAVEVELRRLQLLESTDRYVADLVREVGAPTPAQRARAEALARRIAGRSVRKAG